ncbi:MAG TPA: mannose-1-phosphate guanylyltransferase/mannose-6-phosphate isomerase [Gammaproteobacteria bacterium]|nr:mannose-1-phosphate guanylyltransferase/mannose-6-phosphate isomerase [Gammaproteobacteria bacterium]
MPHILIPVILSGGSGTRLWPLSRPERPKQLLSLVTERTLLQDTLARTSDVRGVTEPIVICNEAHRFLVAEQLRELGVTARAIVLEPGGRNTAPAAAVAALIATAERPAAEAPLLLLLPADHVILDEAAFRAAVEQGIAAAAAGKLVTFGIVPTKPETGYGYIRLGADRGGSYDVAQFVEKPDLATAERYVTSGEYLWNSGMFLFSARAYLDELARFAPAMLPACRRALEHAARDTDFLRLDDAFLDCPSDSIDYAVMERTAAAAVVPLDAGWSDVGSWAALHDVLDKDAEGNVLRGRVIAQGCSDCYVAATARRVAVIGLTGCTVVETEDAVLVMPHDRAQELKTLVERLKSAAEA